MSVMMIVGMQTREYYRPNQEGRVEVSTYEGKPAHGRAEFHIRVFGSSPILSLPIVFPAKYFVPWHVCGLHRQNSSFLVPDFGLAHAGNWGLNST